MEKTVFFARFRLVVSVYFYGNSKCSSRCLPVYRCAVCYFALGRRKSIRLLFLIGGHVHLCLLVFFSFVLCYFSFSFPFSLSLSLFAIFLNFLFWCPLVFLSLLSRVRISPRNPGTSYAYGNPGTIMFAYFMYVPSHPKYKTHFSIKRLEKLVGRFIVYISIFFLLGVCVLCRGWKWNGGEYRSAKRNRMDKLDLLVCYSV